MSDVVVVWTGTAGEFTDWVRAVLDPQLPGDTPDLRGFITPSGTFHINIRCQGDLERLRGVDSAPSRLIRHGTWQTALPDSERMRILATLARAGMAKLALNDSEPDGLSPEALERARVELVSMADHLARDSA